MTDDDVDAVIELMNSRREEQLRSFTIAEIAMHLQRRGYSPNHVIDLGEGSWYLEHPIVCRLMQLDEVNNVTHTLRETCAVNQAFEHGLADVLFERRGAGRYSLSPDDIEALLGRGDVVVDDNGVWHA